MTFTNIRGTSEPQFRISLSGPTIYHGNAAPGVGTPPSSDIYDALHEGDIYILHAGTSSSMYQFIGPTDTDWVEFLVTGGTAPTITSDLSVHGTFDTYDNIITLNSQPSALVDGIGGMEVLRLSGGSETVQWIWNDFNSYWEPSTDASTPNTGLHNVHVENNLTVGGTVAGRLTAPDGLAATPGIRFSASGTGIYATATTLGFSTDGSSRWLIDASGNLLPEATQDIGTSLIPAGDIYSTLFIGEDGLETAPTFTFNTDTTTGLYHDTGAIVFSSGGAEVARVDTTEMELQGTLKITDGANNWTIDNDGADSNKLKLAYNATDEVVITTSGEILVGDGDTGAGLGPFVPSYSFLNNPATGILLDSTDIVFTLGGVSKHLIISPTAITAPGATVFSDPQSLTTRAYVDSVAGGAWQEPVIVKEDTSYPDLATAQAAMNSGLVDGVSMTNGDRILYTGFPPLPPLPPVGPPHNTIYFISGIPGSGALLLNADTGVAASTEASDGDTVYVIDGTNTNNVYSYNKDNSWTEISATSGFGGTLYFNYETQATSGISLYTLANIKYAPTSDGSRLLVYINGVKQVVGAAYTEVSETSITFIVPPPIGQTIEFYAVGLATNDGILKQEVQDNITGTPLIPLNTITYVKDQDGLLVFLNGQKMIANSPSNPVGVTPNYDEILAGTSIQWLSPTLLATDVLEFYSSVPIVAGVDLEDISNVSAVVAPLDNDQLTYNSMSGLWEPRAQGTSQVGLLYDESGGLGIIGTINGTNPTFLTTDVTTNSKNLFGPSKRSYVQVFVNGVLQREGVLATDDYVLSLLPSTITFNIGSIPQFGDTITIFQL